jgi:hypothetical protein
LHHVFLYTAGENRDELLRRHITKVQRVKEAVFGLFFNLCGASHASEYFNAICDIYRIMLCDMEITTNKPTS